MDTIITPLLIWMCVLGHCHAKNFQLSGRILKVVCQNWLAFGTIQNCNGRVNTTHIFFSSLHILTSFYVGSNPSEFFPPQICSKEPEPHCPLTYHCVPFDPFSNLPKDKAFGNEIKQNMLPLSVLMAGEWNTKCCKCWPVCNLAPQEFWIIWYYLPGTSSGKVWGWGKDFYPSNFDWDAQGVFEVPANFPVVENDLINDFSVDFDLNFEWWISWHCSNYLTQLLQMASFNQ